VIADLSGRCLRLTSFSVVLMLVIVIVSAALIFLLSKSDYQRQLPLGIHNTLTYHDASMCSLTVARNSL
jgi:hypothetical protein